MSRTGVKCDMDCLRCKFKDCINTGQIMTKEERAIITGAQGGWERENLIMTVSHALASGISSNIVRDALGMDQRHWGQLMYHVKKSRSRLASGTAQ